MRPWATAATGSDSVMPTRAQKARAFKTWQLFLEGPRSMVRKVRTDLAERGAQKGFHLADTGASVARLSLEDAGGGSTVPFSWR